MSTLTLRFCPDAISRRLTRACTVAPCAITVDVQRTVTLACLTRRPMWAALPVAALRRSLIPVALTSRLALGCAWRPRAIAVTIHRAVVLPGPTVRRPWTLCATARLSYSLHPYALARQLTAAGTRLPTALTVDILRALVISRSTVRCLRRAQRTMTTWGYSLSPSTLCRNLTSVAARLPTAFAIDIQRTATHTRPTGRCCGWAYSSSALWSNSLDPRAVTRCFARRCTL